MTAAGARLRVLCVTPSGIEGRGGIDRLYLYLRAGNGATVMNGIDLRFGAARGGASGALWPLSFPGRLLALARQMRAFRPQIVHINFANRGSALRKYAVLRLARHYGARVVVHLHDSLPETSLRQGGAAGRLFLAICQGADRVVALGHASAEAMARHGIARETIRVVLNGIPDFAADRPLPKPGRETVSILLAGRVGAHKGVNVLVDALAILAARNLAGWRCIVAGDGEVEAFVAEAARKGIADRIRFTGWLEAEAVHDLMRDAEIVVLPSIAEALPLSLAEGACAGAALVATPVGNVAEIVRNGENGFLVSRQADAFADAIGHLIANRDALARMQVASRRHYLERLTLDAFAEALATIYRDLAVASGIVAASMPVGTTAGVSEPHELA